MKAGGKLGELQKKFVPPGKDGMSSQLSGLVCHRKKKDIPVENVVA